MGKHTKFDDSGSDSDEVERKSRKEEKKDAKKEKRDRSRSPHKERERSPKRDRHGEKNDSRRRDDKDHGRRRDYGREDQRDDRGNDRRDDRRDERRDDRKGWKRDRNDRNDRRSDFQKRDDKTRLSAEEIAAQRKALWGSKKAAAEPSTNAESTSTSAETVPGGKNEKLWSSAIAATGVDSSQANKFMRLMGVKNAPKPADDSSRLSAEKNRQDKMLNDLERQYAVARETTHMGRGTGFGFH